MASPLVKKQTFPKHIPLVSCKLNLKAKRHVAITSVIAHDVAALGLLWDHGPDLFGQGPVHPLHRLQGVRGVDHYDPENKIREDSK